MTSSTGPDQNRRTIVLGGGLTGISAALHLDGDYLVIERENRLGGLATTEHKDGFRFDHTGHWLHLRDDYIKGLIARLLGDEMVQVERKARIFSHGALTLYPFQANLKGLPTEVIHECLLGFVNTLVQRQDKAPPRNFEQYILHHFGEGIARHFMIPYNSKLWGVHPREITSAWCSRFVPIPSAEQVIAGAVGAGPAQLGYNVRFNYPKQGGIETVSRALIGEIDAARIELGCTPDAINPLARTITIGGETIPYHALISSIPLPRLVELLQGAPEDVLEAAAKLRATSLRYLNVATRRAPPADWHWVYVPEARFPFYRVGVFSNAVASMAPEGQASLYVELSTRSPISESEKRDALRALVEIGALQSIDDVVFADERVIDPAYVIFDDAYEPSLERIHSYLESHRIYSRGRYGSWIYNAMEDSLLAGKAAAEAANALPRE
jgi:protoporphyrinogen oxidase